MILNTPPSSIESPAICKRCAAEVTLLSMVNSIEVENGGDQDLSYFGAENGKDFSSLEHELARALSLNIDSSNNESPSFVDNRMSKLKGRDNSFDNQYNSSSKRKNSGEEQGSRTGPEDRNKKIFCNKSFKNLLHNNPSQIDIGEIDYCADEEDVSLCEEESCEEEVDSCLAKDSQPEFDDKRERLGLVSDNDVATSSSCSGENGAEIENGKALGKMCSSGFGVTNCGKLALPKRIHSESDLEEEEEEFVDANLVSEELTAAELECAKDVDIVRTSKRSKVRSFLD